MSINNPMKSPEQKQRMSINNPMKNNDIARKVGEQRKRPIIINSVRYLSQVDASESLNVRTNTIFVWLRRGYDGSGNPCRYADEQQRDFNFKKTNSKKVKVDEQLFNSVKDAADYIGCWPETIIRSIKNNKLCHGYKCEYANQHPSYGNQ